MEREYRDEKRLRELYWENKMSAAEIAERSDVSETTIYDWMRRHGIERRPRTPKASFSTTEDGYEYWQAWNPERGQSDWVPVHRLVAVAEYGFDAVCDNQVHHATGIKWDNRPSNLILSSASEHAKRHQEDWHTDICPNCGYQFHE